MTAFEAFNANLDRMERNGTTSFHLPHSQIRDFAYCCLPLLKAAGLPADFDTCVKAIEAGDFTLNGIRICRAQVERLRPQPWPHGNFRNTGFR